jgi:hypothetical protein
MKTELAAEKYSKEKWGVYFDDKHPDVAITDTCGEISIKDFIAGAKHKEQTMFSEEEVLEILFLATCNSESDKEEMRLWFQQFSKLKKNDK